VPTGVLPDGSRAFLWFTGDRSWKASNGCLTLGGPVSAGEQGRIEAVGPSVLPAVGCLHTVAVVDWLLQADRLALDGGVLVLLGTDGAPLARLERAAAR